MDSGNAEFFRLARRKLFSEQGLESSVLPLFRKDGQRSPNGISQRFLSMIRPLAPALLALSLCACAAPQSPGIRLALTGPPLAVAMRGESSVWSGLMDRGCMVGVGSMTLRDAEGVICKGDMDHPATEKGRLYADLTCSDGGTLALVFRNLGPDQGMGLARRNPETENGEQITLFFHPAREEAERRLAEIRQEISEALQAKRKSGDKAN